MSCCCSTSRTVTLKIEGMSCEHCRLSVEKALQSLKGVEKAQVDLGAKAATVTYNPTAVTVEDLKKAVVEAGYEVTAAS
ncbi:MAG: heavy-metal-associated domain-containing protein [Moorellaceae bacterium]